MSRRCLVSSLAAVIVVLTLNAPAFAGALPVPTGDVSAGSPKSTEFMHARYYSPDLGRFLSVDPVGGSVGSSQSWNRYSYVVNNPMNLIDPSGEMWFEFDGEWVFFDGVDELKQTVVNDDGSSSEATVAGLESLVTFDGRVLTLFSLDWSSYSFDAVSGKGASLEAGSDPTSQDKAGTGAIPEGEWSFDPAEIQRLGMFSLNNAVGLLGSLFGEKWGAWPGGMFAWGHQRAWLDPALGTETYGRTGFSIHGGWRPGSAGCIDTGPNASRLFGLVDDQTGPVPVFVTYR